MHNAAPRWTAPVRVHLQCGLERGFVCVHDALDFLQYEWPSRTGTLYARAANLCRLALDGGLPADIAREAFIFACLEAGMPVASERRSRRRHERAMTHSQPASWLTTPLTRGWPTLSPMVAEA